MSCNGPGPGRGRKKSFIRIEHRAGAVSRECLVQEKIAVLTLLPSKWVRALAPSYLLQRQPERVFTLHQSMAQKTYPLCDVPFSRSAMRTFTPAQKISSKSPNPARFSWRPKHYPVLYEHTATATRKGKRKEKRKGFFVFLFGE